EVSLDEIALFPAQIGVVDGYAFREKRKKQILRVRLLERIEFLDRARRSGKIDHLFECFADRFRAELVRQKNNALFIVCLGEMLPRVYCNTLVFIPFGQGPFLLAFDAAVVFEVTENISGDNSLPQFHRLWGSDKKLGFEPP